MTNKRFVMIYFETDGNLIFNDETGEKEWFDSTECMQDEEIVEMLNALHEENQELRMDNDIKFWKHQFMSQYNENQVILHELSLAINKGYEISDKFKKWIEDSAERNKEVMEKNERLFE